MEFVQRPPKVVLGDAVLMADYFLGVHHCVYHSLQQWSILQLITSEISKSASWFTMEADIHLISQTANQEIDNGVFS